MNTLRHQALLALVAVCIGLALGVASTVLGQKGGGNYATSNGPSEPPPPPPQLPAPKLPALRVYEWGVATLNWDGTPETEETMPTAFYAADKIAIAPPIARQPKPDVQPVKPDPEKPVIKPRKPVLYFEHDLSAEREIRFDIDVRFPNGRLTWLYPKPNRRLDATTAQWDNIELVNAGTQKRLGGKLPAPALFEAGHWAQTAREGSQTSLLVNGETERYLFYEGEQFDLPELDLFVAADGSLHIQNHGAWPVFDVRVNVTHNGQVRTHYVATIGAASGEKPADLELPANSDDLLAEPGILARETATAGLTPAQAGVFDKIWRQTLLGKSQTLSWRRAPRALDELAEIKLTLPVGMASEVKRVGYVLASHVDLARQPDLEALALKAANDDATAAAALQKAGMAGAGALRRKLADTTLTLSQRLALAKVLSDMRLR